MNNITPKLATARSFLAVASIPLVIFCRGVHPAHAQTKSSQDKQILYQVDYVPLREGSAVLGQPLVQVKINGTQDALFLVDTGSSTGIISTELAKRLSLRLEPAMGNDAKPSFWKDKPGTMTRLSTLRIGTLTVTDAPLLVPGAETFTPSPRSAYSSPPDGILGLNLLRHFAVMLDSGRHTFGLGLPGDLSRRQLAQLGFTQPYILPIVKKNGMWFAQARFTNGGISGTEDLRLTLDVKST